MYQATQAPAMPEGGLGGLLAAQQPGAGQANPALDCGASHDASLLDINQQVLAGRLDVAKTSYATQLARSDPAANPLSAAALEANLGVVAAAQGRYAEAKERLEQALRRYEAQAAAPVLPPGGPSTSGLAEQLRRFGMNPAMVDLDAAMAPMLDSQQSMQAQLAHAGVFRTLLNLGNLAGQLGQYADAETQFKRALAQAAKLQEPAAERFVFAEFAVLYGKTGQSAAAAEYRRRLQGAGTPAFLISAVGFQVVALGRSAASAASPLDNDEAVQNRPSRYAEAAQLRMQAEAQAFERAGDRAAAALVYSRSALLAASVATPEREHAALADLARVHAAGAAPALAIFSGKRAVNAAQRLRGEVGTMERQARQAYLADKKRSYTTLAGLLLQQGRLAEAEQVLRLLKEDEGQQFRRPLKAQAAARGAIPFSLAEAGYQARYAALARQTQELEAQRQALQCGLFGGGAGIDDRSQQERMRLEAALQIDSMIGQMEDGQQLSQLAGMAAQAQAIAAKPASARSAAERQSLLTYQQGIRLFTQMVDGMGASLRAVRRDGQYFVQPVSAADAAKLDALAKRVANLQARQAPLTAFLANEPPAPALPQAQEKMVAQLLGFGMGQMQGAWAIDRQLEALDAERGRLDAELTAALGGTARGAEPQFAAADAALLDTGRQLLGRLPAGTVAIYYLSGEQALDALVVSRDGRSTVRQALPRSQLEQRIKAFRALLQNPRADAQPSAKALYEVLIAPLAGTLRDAKASTLMLALDGQLRYLPFAALYDGQAWLAERYALDLYTTAAPAALTAAPAAKWRAAAFGSTVGGEGFSPLPAVRAELEGVVRDASLKTQGALPGVIHIDRAFTAAALRDALRNRQNVVHIASHFAFRAGDASASFLLLGDGGKLSLAEMAGADYRFDQVDLVTLSACETALSGDDSFGQEVEGLGTLLQGQGAAAVLATLWSVADDSTARFMRQLYALREQRSLSRAEALRAAQLAFIRGSDAAPAGEAQRGATRPGEAGVAAFRADAARPFAHPYFWAPFVLMGNWL